MRSISNPSRLDPLRRAGFSQPAPESTKHSVPGRRYLLEILPHAAALFDCDAAGMLVEANSQFHDAFCRQRPLLGLADLDALFGEAPGLASLITGNDPGDTRPRAAGHGKLVRDTQGRNYALSYRFSRGPAVKNGLLVMAHDVTAMLQQFTGDAANSSTASVNPAGAKPAPASLNALTAREREVLKLVVDGKLNKTIADILGISIKTVELHRSHVMRKMGARNVAELVKLTLNVA